MFDFLLAPLKNLDEASAYWIVTDLICQYFPVVNLSNDRMTINNLIVTTICDIALNFDLLELSQRAKPAHHFHPICRLEKIITSCNAIKEFDFSKSNSESINSLRESIHLEIDGRQISDIDDRNLKYVQDYSEHIAKKQEFMAESTNSDDICHPLLLDCARVFLKDSELAFKKRIEFTDLLSNPDTYLAQWPHLPEVPVLMYAKDGRGIMRTRGQDTSESDRKRLLYTFVAMNIVDNLLGRSKLVCPMSDMGLQCPLQEQFLNTGLSDCYCGVVLKGALGFEC